MAPAQPSVQCSGSIQRLLLPLMYAAAVPAPGFRDSGNNGKNGALMNVGNNGFSWSSAVSGTNAVYLNFNTQNLNPSNVNNRGFGLQVRCLQAFIGRLVRHRPTEDVHLFSRRTVPEYLPATGCG